MPRAVDLDARRAEIADALLRLVEERGLAAATMRETAAAAGVSLGAVQRCFATREEMVLFALTRINERFRARVLAAVSPTAGPRESARTLVTQMLPFAEPGRADARVALAFLGVAAGDPQVAAALRVGDRGAREFFTRHLAGFGHPPVAATRLLALIDGLRAPLLLGHLAPDDALAAIDAHLDELF
ncbi:MULTISPECIES: TetR/AcrR family transcriptional regulator [Catenuloplanes]|uniref:AcrR family transcriptional regulator n=1 Tax=Catenuloplanes niger TaxID=587534 RepID=A0AAE3ZZQ2_9ACTN|nr:TetR family transcriptional regulator C-terminal domain-containing protein [Catenuloplanes niger]MDR7327965.1 AcrR family transcriptional regulator [Catenuloplanes niger]